MEWQPTPVFLPGEFPWTEEPGGLQSMESKELDMTDQLTQLQHEVPFPTLQILWFFPVPTGLTCVRALSALDNHPWKWHGRNETV